MMAPRIDIQRHGNDKVSANFQVAISGKRDRIPGFSELPGIIQRGDAAT
jgi:hypothetical protein